MPYIIKKIEGEEINVNNQGVLILDKEKNFKLEETHGSGLSYEKIIELKSSFSHLNFLKDVNYLNDNERALIIQEIKDVENFYENIWERTLIELMFITQYYMSLISNLQSFDQIVKTNDQFEYWFLNNVEYTMLEKIKEFYIKTCKAYADISTINIYEQDVEAKAKDIVNRIQKYHVNDVKEMLESKWDETYEEHKKWKIKEEEKRKTMIFD
ncbi:MAG: hypothetical protein HDR43_02845 [Mycoplasma sp.]|nr:hypothetical protein [Mycoplasma sp.]